MLLKLGICQGQGLTMLLMSLGCGNIVPCPSETVNLAVHCPPLVVLSGSCRAFVMEQKLLYSRTQITVIKVSG